MNVEEAIQGLTAVMVSDPSLPGILYGGPGVGKSSAVREARERADRLLPETDRFCGIMDLRLNSKNPVELYGLPVREGEKARWIAPDFFHVLAREKWILLLEELTTAPLASMHAGLEIVQERKVGNIAFHPGTMVVACANSLSDRAGVSSLTAPLANRFAFHLEILADLRTFERYALRKGISPLILGFLETRPEFLYRLPREGEIHGWPSPRSWEALSRLMAFLPLTETLAVSAVGEEAGGVLVAWSESAHILELTEEIARTGRAGQKRLATSEQVALIWALSARLLRDPEARENIAQFVVRTLGPESQMLFFTEVAQAADPKDRTELSRLSGWREFVKAHPDTWRGI